jgi:hypothetical protein
MRWLLSPSAEVARAGGLARIALARQRHKGKGQQAYEARRATIAQERQRQAELVRCVFGNPFRRVLLQSSWRSSTVLALAAHAYAEGDFTMFPVLADALEDACCDCAEILGHLRGPGLHSGGCWVLDALRTP